MTLERATAEIDAKRDELSQIGFDVGESRRDTHDAGSGGFIHEFTNTNIYWHANTGAHEVHGRILEKYLKLGGPGRNPRTGRRDFGFPKTDELQTGTQTSKFEFGDIYNVPGFEAIGVYGPSRTLIPGPYGLPIAEPVEAAEGGSVYCERGAFFLPTGAGGVITASLHMPQLGRPSLIPLVGGQTLPVRIVMTIYKEVWETLLAQQTGAVTTTRREQVLVALTDLWANRLLMRAVVDKSATWPLAVDVDGVIESADVTVTLRVSLPPERSLPDRTLLDVGLSLPDTRIYPLAPHALYARHDWSAFGFLHTTDLHVTHRAESFRRRLREAGLPRSASAMNNPNDCIRTLFAYANRLHDEGLIDFMLATGDLVDYIYEHGDDRKGGGNFRFLERLILGQAPSSDPAGAPNPELHVPIFTILGNHDYVLNPSELWFECNLDGLENPIIRRFEPYNLSGDDAKAIQGGKKLLLSRETCEQMLESLDRPHWYYEQRINRQPNYVIELGDKHRIVMLDTGPNADVITGIGDAIEEFLGASNQDETTFVKGTPNTAGRDLTVFRDALRDTPADGILVVGMHAPPLNVWRNEYPHYFRETERAGYDEKKLNDLIGGFLSRHSLSPLVVHDTWRRDTSTEFKRGSIGDLLDFGIATWGGADFLDLCANPKVDLVLCGHVHEKVEFRIRRDPNGGFRYFTDFYTENPAEHRESFDWRKAFIGQGPSFTIEGDTRPLFIGVDPEAPVDGPIVEVTDHRPNTPVTFRRLKVPPYDSSLADSTDKPDWWARNRPLILQTACVGPLDHSRRVSAGNMARATFQGIRALRVDDGHISLIRYVGIADVRAGLPPKGFVKTGPEGWLEPVLMVMMN